MPEAETENEDDEKMLEAPDSSDEELLEPAPKDRPMSHDFSDEIDELDKTMASAESPPEPPKPKNIDVIHTGE